MIAGGLVAFSLIMIQAFISLGQPDTPTLISIIAFAIAIPMLVFSFLLNELFHITTKLEVTRGYRFIWSLGIFSSIVGIVAAFWHISWYAGLAMIISGFIGSIVFISNDVQVKNYLARQHQEESRETTIPPDNEEHP